MGQEGISQRSASHVCPGQLCLSPDLPELTPMKWGGGGMWPVAGEARPALRLRPFLD